MVHGKRKINRERGISTEFQTMRGISEDHLDPRETEPKARDLVRVAKFGSGFEGTEFPEPVKFQGRSEPSKTRDNWG